jgi:hypothetical protein
VAVAFLAFWGAEFVRYGSFVFDGFIIERIFMYLSFFGKDFFLEDHIMRVDDLIGIVIKNPVVSIKLIKTH